MLDTIALADTGYTENTCEGLFHFQMVWRRRTPEDRYPEAGPREISVSSLL